MDCEDIRFIDLFGGIGGFRLGLERASPRFKCVWYCDNDKYAVQVYNKQFNEYHKPTDIRKVKTNEIPEFDMLCGGFPCQAFSIAGKRKGFRDTKGTLFFEIAKILNDRHPPYLLLENVKGLLNHDNGSTFRTILRTLDELGYDAEWQVLNSKYFGVPQNRERVFIIGYTGRKRGLQVFPLGEIHKGNITTQEETQGDGSWLRSHNKQTANTLSARYYKDGSEILIEENRKQIVSAQRIGQEGELRTYDDISPTIQTPSGGGHLPMVLAWSQSHRDYKDEPEQRIKLGEFNTLNTGEGCRSQSTQNFVLKKAVALTERRTDKAKAIRKQHRKEGIDWCPRREKELIPRSDNNANCVTAGISKESFIYEIEQEMKQLSGNIRRLTPKECERLQGFPDDWTNIQISDTQRYKQLGNAVTVNVIQAIGTAFLNKIDTDFQPPPIKFGTPKTLDDFF